MLRMSLSSMGVSWFAAFLVFHPPNHPSNVVFLTRILIYYPLRVEGGILHHLLLWYFVFRNFRYFLIGGRAGCFFQLRLPFLFIEGEVCAPLLPEGAGSACPCIPHIGIYIGAELDNIILLPFFFGCSLN